MTKTQFQDVTKRSTNNLHMYESTIILVLFSTTSLCNLCTQIESEVVVASLLELEPTGLNRYVCSMHVPY